MVEPHEQNDVQTTNTNERGEHGAGVADAGTPWEPQVPRDGEGRCMSHLGFSVRADVIEAVKQPMGG